MVEVAHFKIDWEEHSVTPISKYPLIPSQRNLEPTEDQPQWLQETLVGLRNVDDKDHDEIDRVAQRGAERWLDQLLKRKPRFITERREIISEFETRLLNRWNNALELYELLVIFAQDLDLEYGQATFTDVTDHRREAILGLHRRACVTASEILHLLKGGYAAGAQARWRTLHELVAVALFLLRHDDSISEKYLLHDAYVDRFKVADLYRQRGLYQEDEEFAALKAKFEELGTIHGKPFLKDWGWAASTIQGNPNFARIEEAVCLDRFRASYKVASRAVHSNSSNGLASIYSFDGVDIPLIGPTNAGLAEPATAALDSLTKITAILLDQRGGLVDGMAVRVLNCLYDQAFEAFLEAHDKMVEEENARRTN